MSLNESIRKDVAVANSERTHRRQVLHVGKLHTLTTTTGVERSYINLPLF